MERNDHVDTQDGPGAFISMIIPVIVFFVFQRYFVEGLLAGSIK